MVDEWYMIMELLWNNMGGKTEVLGEKPVCMSKSVFFTAIVSC